MHPLLKTTTAAAVLACSATARAQAPDSFAPAPAQNSPATETAPAAPASPSSTTDPIGRRNTQFLGGDIPVFNPGSEMLTWDGQSWNVTNNRLFQARFEKFLNAEPETDEEDQAYRNVIKEIMDLLAPGNATTSHIDQAFRLLPRASNYDIDANLCDSIANAVYSVWMAQRENQRLRAANDSLEKELKIHQWNAQLAASNALDRNRFSKEEAEKDKSDRAMRRDLRVQPYLKLAAEVEATRAANKVKREALLLQTKIEFQALIVQHFLQRRFQHVVIATRFYRNLFKDGDTLLRVEEDTKEFFTKSTGMPPTVGVLDSIANEMMRDASEGVEAYQFLLEKNELQSAANRLAEAFAIGEYLPSLRTLPREGKRQALKFTQLSNQLVSALDVKDYSLAENLVEQLSVLAKDFDSSKAMAAIETARTVSAMHLAKARNAAVSGDRETLESELKAATEIWPRNPALAEISGAIFSQSDVQMQAISDFDQLVSQKNFRKIFEDKLRFIAAAAMYPEKQEVLEEVLDSMQKIEGAIIQAKEVARHGDFAGAWEIVEAMHTDFPDDSKLNQLRAELTTQAADFVQTLRKAQQLEEKGMSGSSLAWYLKARQIYPESAYAQAGISRLVQEILPEAETAGLRSMIGDSIAIAMRIRH